MRQLVVNHMQGASHSQKINLEIQDHLFLCYNLAAPSEHFGRGYLTNQ